MAPISDPNAPVVVHYDYENENKTTQKPEAKQRKRTLSNSKQEYQSRNVIFRPESEKLLDDMLYPLTRSEFLQNHFRKDAVCIQRRQRPQESNGENGKKLKSTKKNKKSQNGNNHPILENNGDDSYQGNREMVSYICQKYLFDLDIRQIFAETSSENVFLWLRPPSHSKATPENSASASATKSLNSVEIPDPETAYALHTSASHPAYCRAPPPLEQLLVGSLLRSTGLGGGHYHPPHLETTTLGGGTTLGRGEVELFISAANAGKRYNDSHEFKSGSSLKDINYIGDSGQSTTNTTGWHTDFQENFTIQLSGVKRWTLRRGRVRHPIRATTPHYCREASVVENQLKIARLCCLSGVEEGAGHKNATEESEGQARSYGFEYNDNNTIGPEQTVTLFPGDVLYFPSGMWHRVEAIEPGVSMNVSLMGTTYATLVCDSLRHLLVGSNEGWREVVAYRPGDKDGIKRLQELLGGLSKVVDDFVKSGGGAQSVLPPALRFPPLENSIDEADEEEEEGGELGEYENGGEEEEIDLDEERMEDDSIEIKDDDGPISGIVVPVDDFEGPQHWSCDRPPEAKLVKNPLASLVAMSEVTSHLSPDDRNEGQSGQNEDKSKKYILNVNFAGNEMCESHIRVILETKESIELIDWYLKCEAEGKDPAGVFNEIDTERGGVKNPKDDTNISYEVTAGMIPPLCLFYYGYFSWNESIAKENIESAESRMIPHQTRKRKKGQ